MKIIEAKDVSGLIKNGYFIAVDGFVGIGIPEEILKEIENSFLCENEPRNLSLIFAAGFGDGSEKGLNRLAHRGLLKKVIGGHWGLAPSLGKLAVEEEIEAYNFPQGVLSQMFRDMAAGKPGTLSYVGLETFVDPDINGGKLNSKTSENLVQKIKIEEEDILFFKAPKLDVAILRGTSSDKDGNISFEKEALTLEALSIATAVKNNGGKVFVQVERMVKSISPKDVKIPGILVDYVVISEASNHMQTLSEQFNEMYVSNHLMLQEGGLSDFILDERKIIARRSAMVLGKEKRILNYGIGMPEMIPLVLREEKQEKWFIPTVEPGAIGGTPMGGLNFGASINPTCIIDQPYQFDFYDGGGLDVAFLGLAQCDAVGNINVSKFGPKIAGCGGFINITQNAKEVVFCGTFTAGGLKIKVENGELRIIQEGKIKKFVADLDQITFSGNLAAGKGKKVLYITERAVFELRKEGLTLIEIAPGIDLQKDILNQMDFVPLIAKDLKQIDAKIYKEEKMELEF
ncbi:acyl CoA:acetate/3-ketoacid CoA transferase [Fusobacterium necrophorum]|uniref:acyl CoA:acetate/3-ketoacid CoA transferase n=1 Tax=Fusobacterium necrophorum TaxID=859 RepID=UPI00254CFCB3|nr:acyl CoA:acetate/3-ketoacid CoA transferase [Fusobacterium necrophorum]MDK4510505.1 acyl CoA:acetate/3-ketoacid CoA transferase [Fusobacterium necrophorum]